MNPIYSIQEIADVLDKEVYAICNILVACDVPSFFNGKKVDLSEYDCFRPMYLGESIVVFTGGPPGPSPATIFVSAEALPESWAQSIEDAEHSDLTEEMAAVAATEEQVNGESPLASQDSKKWPWGNHETELLRKLAAAADRFWQRYDHTDATTAPTNKQVIDWLKTKGVAQRTAEVMATILRADGLPTGPRK
jgi:hypothetical protein